MAPQYRWALLASLAATFSPSLSQARLGEDAKADWSAKSAAQYLDGRAEWWLGWSRASRGQGTVCVSCHTAVPFALARSTLSERLGEMTLSAPEQRLIDNVKKRVLNWDQIVADSNDDKDPFVSFYPGDKKPSALGTEAVLSALVLVSADPGRVDGSMNNATKMALNHLWEQQQANGAWLWLEFATNPWEKDGAYYGASLAALAVGRAGKTYNDRPELRAKIANLKKYLQTQSANESLHNRLMGLWAASALPDTLSEPDKKQLMAEVLKLQEADGGWSLPRLGKKASGPGDWKTHGAYPEGTVSDGYATGLVVLALKRAGMPSDDPALNKATAWLASHQKDGTWPINYPNKPRDPQSEIGKLMRDASTAFSIMALADK
jgi:squalene-hopene/tetraprenyl-beta-curcumene cyclase